MRFQYVPVVAPADRIESAAAYEGPTFLRLSRVGVPDLVNDGHRFERGKANLLCEGDDVTIIANGTLTHQEVEAAEILKNNNFNVRVLNMASVRAIDADAILAAATETSAIVTCEEHTVYGGLGSAVAEVVVKSQPVLMKMLGVSGIFAPTGSANFLLD